MRENPDTRQLTPEGLCVTITIWMGRSQALEDGLVGVRYRPERRFQHVHHSFCEDLPMWTQGTDLQNSPGKSRNCRDPAQRSREYSCSPVEKVLETKRLHSFKAMSLSSNLICVPKVWSLGPWFIQVRELFCRASRLGPENHFLLVQLRTVYYGSV